MAMRRRDITQKIREDPYPKSKSNSQNTVDKEGNEAIAEGRGRHDPCVVPRAVPIVEAMAALVLVDHILRDKAVRL